MLYVCQWLYQEGKFVEFGFFNYVSWEVVEICIFCKSNGWILFIVYQGMYNVIIWQVEMEFFFCFRYFGLRFYVYNFLVGGLLIGKYKYEDKDGKQFVGCFFGNSWVEIYRNCFWKEYYFEVIVLVEKVLQVVYGVSVFSVILVVFWWMYYYLQLQGVYGDVVILGMFSLEQLEQNLVVIEEGFLELVVVDVFN